jgi:hypothetical protein
MRYAQLYTTLPSRCWHGIDIAADQLRRVQVTWVAIISLPEDPHNHRTARDGDLTDLGFDYATLSEVIVLEKGDYYQHKQDTFHVQKYSR